MQSLFLKVNLKEMKNMVKCHQSALINDEFILEPRRVLKGGRTTPSGLLVEAHTPWREGS